MAFLDCTTPSKVDVLKMQSSIRHEDTALQGGASVNLLMLPGRTWAAGTGYGTGYGTGRSGSRGEVWDARQGEAMQVGMLNSVDDLPIY